MVSTRVGAIDEAVVDGVNGFLITPGDGEALTSILNRLASDPELRQFLGKTAGKWLRNYLMPLKMDNGYWKSARI